MKFTQEEAIEELKGRFASKVKDIDLTRTINNAVETCMSMVGDNNEMELSMFSDHAEKLVSSALGLARHENANVATRLQEKIAELEKKQTTTTTDIKDNTDKHSVSPELQAVMEKLNKLESAQLQRDREETIKAKRKSLKAKMVEKGISDKEWIDSYLKEIVVTEETDVDAKAVDYVAFYNKTVSKGGTITPKQPGGNDTNSYVSETIKSVLNDREQRNKTK